MRFLVLPFSRTLDAPHARHTEFVASPFRSPTIALSSQMPPYTVDMDPNSWPSLVAFEASQPCLLDPLAV